MLKKTENTNTTVTTNVSGKSIIEKDGDRVVVVDMNATVSKQNGKVTGYTQNYSNILDAELYTANKAACKADMIEFNNYIDTLLEEGAVKNSEN